MYRVDISHPEMDTILSFETDDLEDAESERDYHEEIGMYVRIFKDGVEI